jgi:hypothetical protein
VVRHPFGARQIAVERPPGAICFTFRIKMQHHSRDVAPVCACRIRVEQEDLTGLRHAFHLNKEIWMR